MKTRSFVKAVTWAINEFLEKEEPLLDSPESKLKDLHLEIAYEGVNTWTRFMYIDYIRFKKLCEI